VITVGNAIGGGSIWISAASSILGALIIILIGISELKKYQENWILFGTNEEALRRQYYLWKNEAGEYSDIPTEHERRKLLVEKVEAILLSQYSAFFGIHKEKPSVPTGTSAAATPETPAAATPETPAANAAKAPVQKSPPTETDSKPETRTHKPPTKPKKRKSTKSTKRKSSSKKTKKKTSRRKRK